MRGDLGGGRAQREASPLKVAEEKSARARLRTALRPAAGRARKKEQLHPDHGPIRTRWKLPVELNGEVALPGGGCGGRESRTEQCRTGGCCGPWR